MRSCSVANHIKTQINRSKRFVIILESINCKNAPTLILTHIKRRQMLRLKVPQMKEPFRRNCVEKEEQRQHVLLHVFCGTKQAKETQFCHSSAAFGEWRLLVLFGHLLCSRTHNLLLTTFYNVLHLLTFFFVFCAQSLPHNSWAYDICPNGPARMSAGIMGAARSYPMHSAVHCSSSPHLSGRLQRFPFNWHLFRAFSFSHGEEKEYVRRISHYCCSLIGLYRFDQMSGCSRESHQWEDYL